MTIEQQIAEIIKDVWEECCWAESIEECEEIIAKGRQKVDALSDAPEVCDATVSNKELKLVP